jgi:cell division septation protein DedD
VVVGSFADPANASRLATGLRNRGYPAGLETAGGYTRVWVGPYADQTRAQSVAGGLSQYSPKVVRAPATANPQRQPSSAQSPSAASPGSGRFLQVGAYKSREGATPMLAKVKEAGYDAVLVEENGLVKVRVGPLDDVAAAKAALQARGLDVLEVR